MSTVDPIAANSTYVDFVGTELALQMMARAYGALALLYEMENPGRYAEVHSKVLEYLAGGFSQVEVAADAHRIDPAAAKAAAVRVRTLMREVTRMADDLANER